MEMELYHIHKKGIKDHKWKVNNTLIIDKTFESRMNERRNSFNQNVWISDGINKELLNNEQYLFNVVENINQFTKKELEEILRSNIQLTFNANLFKRETAMEDYRKDNKIELPSRLHSLYLCDRDGLEYWSEMISEFNTHEIEVFKVYADGLIFKTNEQLIPLETSDYQTTYSESRKYWNPKFKDVPYYTNEYLTQGKIKVIEKI